MYSPIVQHYASKSIEDNVIYKIFVEISGDCVNPSIMCQHNVKVHGIPVSLLLLINF